MIDSEMLGAFKEESNGILNELKTTLDKLSEPSEHFPSALLQDFSQKIDRIMGAAKTLVLEDPKHQGLIRIGTLAELCKHIGYKAAEQKNTKLVPIFAAFWSDVVSVTEDLMGSLEDEAKAKQITKDFAPILIKRLEWLKKKVTSGTAAASASQAAIDDLVASILK